MAASLAIALTACGGPDVPNENTLALCDAVPEALERMQSQRERLTGAGFRENVQPMVMDTYDFLHPVFELAERAASEDREGEFWTIGGAVRGGWFAYVNMDTLDQRQAYMDYSDAIQWLYRADKECSQLEV